MQDCAALEDLLWKTQQVTSFKPRVTHLDLALHIPGCHEAGDIGCRQHLCAPEPAAVPHINVAQQQPIGPAGHGVNGQVNAAACKPLETQAACTRFQEVIKHIMLLLHTRCRYVVDVADIC